MSTQQRIQLIKLLCFVFSQLFRRRSLQKQNKKLNQNTWQTMTLEEGVQRWFELHCVGQCFVSGETTRHCRWFLHWLIDCLEWWNQWNNVEIHRLLRVVWWARDATHQTDRWSHHAAQCWTDRMHLYYMWIVLNMTLPTNINRNKQQTHHDCDQPTATPSTTHEYRCA